MALRTKGWHELRLPCLQLAHLLTADSCCRFWVYGGRPVSAHVYATAAQQGHSEVLSVELEELLPLKLAAKGSGAV